MQSHKRQNLLDGFMLACSEVSLNMQQWEQIMKAATRLMEETEKELLYGDG